MRVTLRTKLLATIGGPLLVGYVAMVTLAFRHNRQVALRSMEDHLSQLAAHHAAAINGELTTVAQIAHSLADGLTARPNFTEEELYLLLRRVLTENPDVFGSCIAFEPGGFDPQRASFAPYVCRDGEGGLTSMDIGTGTYDYAVWDWYLIPQRLRRPVWSEPFFDEGAGNILMCTHSVPFYHADGRLRGIATVDISLAQLQMRVATIPIKGGYCMLLSPQGWFINHPSGELVMRWSIFALAEWYGRPDLADLGARAIAGESGIERLPNYRTGEIEWVIYTPVRSMGWTLGVLVPETHVLAPVVAALRRDLLAGLIGLLAIAAILVVSSHRITQPIRALAGQARRLAAGDLDAQVAGVGGSDEIAEFAATFNKMVADLKAHVAALTEETARRQQVESELHVARSIQSSLLPRVFPPYPNRPEFDLHAVNVPAKEVAGDFFDFFFLSHDMLAVVIADVSGKGVPAALFMAITRTLFRNMEGVGLTPGEVFERVNRILVIDNDEAMFVTVFLAHYDTRTGRMLYSNAGHNYPYVVRPDGSMRPLRAPGGPILGVAPDIDYATAEDALEPGETLVLYTDGVVEAQDLAGQLYGNARFESVLAAHHAEPVDGLCDTIIDVTNDWEHGQRHDDVTLVVLRRKQ